MAQSGFANPVRQPAAAEAGQPEPPEAHQPFRDATISFAVDISGSTYGPTLGAEQSFIHSVTNLLSSRSRFDSKILPWDDRAHSILSLGQVDHLEDRGGTDPCAILASDRYRSTILQSSLWFLMTDGLISSGIRAKFAEDVAAHGVHGVSCVVVIFGNPVAGPASCDISVGIGVFAAVANCAFLFCDETNGDLRVLQTKGTFNVLLKGMAHPVFDSDTQWNSLPQISVADFAAVQLPESKNLKADQIALQGSLVISMEDLFANRLSPEQVANIFESEDNLATVMMTSSARSQQARFQSWARQQIINLDDPLHKLRADSGSRAASLFAELADLARRGQQAPPNLQARLRAAYRDNMKRFIADTNRELTEADEREYLVSAISQSSSLNIHSTPAPSSPVIGRDTMGGKPFMTPPSTRSAPMQPPGAPLQMRVPRATISVPMTAGPSQHRESGNWLQGMDQEAWGSWEELTISHSLFGLLYTPGFRQLSGSFKGTCSVCGATDMTLAWLFRSVELTSSSPGPTAGFPPPHSRTRLAFPLAMGHFAETIGVFTERSSGYAGGGGNGMTTRRRPPLLACEPCSTFFTQTGAQSFGLTAALPLVRYAAVRGIRARFDDADLPQVFLSVLLSAVENIGSPSNSGPTTAPPAPAAAAPSASLSGDGIESAFAAAAAANTFRAAVEWTVGDLRGSLNVIDDLSETFSQSSTSIWPLGNVLYNLFDETYPHGAGINGAPLLRYPLPGFVVMLRAAALNNISWEFRYRATFRRLLVLLCEGICSVLRDLSPQSVSSFL
ncbi:hypothetical protein B0I35DRAFT_484071 [Stachybotrys elegans]|uniref:VWFA domain-containing protein n=1 Tax=Stachybotrys elegans TaxID=80388 RepID=A0A8K0SEG3_9HYPO|nr:hypothetical protein B0I35DRAFT_484071 [Stachybotrys elegans]